MQDTQSYSFFGNISNKRKLCTFLFSFSFFKKQTHTYKGEGNEFLKKKKPSLSMDHRIQNHYY